MNKKFLFIPLTFVLFFCGVQSFSQRKITAEDLALPATHTNTFLHEKVYVHTDRSFYVAGEVMWFKAYVTNAATGKPLAFSKVLYVEVINGSQQPVLQTKISLNDANGDGSFYLPFSLASGNYIFRAYTNFMKNGSPEEFFQKEISIVNTSENAEVKVAKKASNYSAAFFPEGGNLVNGLKSLVGFKVSDSENKGVEADGIVIDQNNDTVAQIRALKFGMGKFFFVPEAGKQYSAIFNFKDGSVTKKLPEALDNGYVMHLDNSDPKNVSISVEAKTDATNTNPQMFVVVQSEKKINTAERAWLQNNKAQFQIPKDSFPTGVSLITVFDGNKNPVSERAFFVKPKNQMLLKATSDKENYGKRSKVVTSVFTTGENGNGLTGDFSASVYKVDDLNQNDEGNIVSYLMLSSPLKGDIENPSYYFENTGAEVDEALENLLLVHGWRKFDTNANSENSLKDINYVPEYAGHFITGKVVNEITNEPAANIPVYLSVPGRRVQLRVCISDSKGMVHFEMKDFYGPHQVVLQTNSEVDSIYRVQIFSPFSEKFSDNDLSNKVSETANSSLYARNMSMQVQQSFHQNELLQILKRPVDSVAFYFQPYRTYVLSNYTRFTTMEEVLREYVLEVNVRKSGSKYRLATFNAPGFELRDMQTSETIFDKNPLVLLDGVPVFNMNKIIGYDPLKVEKIDIVARRYHLGTLTSDGIVTFTTYKGQLEGFKLDPRDIVLDYEGLQEKRVFYSPEYSTKSQVQSRIPDFRQLLFWEPNLKTGANGKTEFSFYTGDVPGRYLIEVQGISEDGIPGFTRTIINVEK